MPAERDFAAKNGSVWPWLLPFYIKACFDIDGDAFLPQAEEALENFDEDIQRYGIGSICELYDADPPYASRGAISQAWSVGAALDIHRMIRERSKGEVRKAENREEKRQNERSEREKAGEDEACGEKRREDGKGRRQKSDRGEGAPRPRRKRRRRKNSAAGKAAKK